MGIFSLALKLHTSLACIPPAGDRHPVTTHLQGRVRTEETLFIGVPQACHKQEAEEE